MPPPEPSSPDDTDATAEASERDVIQWVGIAVIVIGSVLIVGQSAGFLTLNAGTFRYYLAAGVVLTGGAEVVRAVASGP